MTLKQIIALDKECFMNTFGDRVPVAFDHGCGATLTSLDGREYIDFLAGIAVNSLGHAHPALTKALHEQVDKLIHCTNIYYIEKQAELEQLLIKGVSAPLGLKRMFMSNSGAEANECAIKLARKYFYDRGDNRTQIITARDSFHGRTLTTVAATGQEKYQKPYRPLIPGFEHVPFGDIDALAARVSDATCAVMLEVIQGESGVITASQDYFNQVQQLCRAHGALLIIDEIQTGVYRTGRFFGFENYGLEPDIISMAKALGGGVPVGATIAREQVAQAFTPSDHGGTFGGNPLACAAAVAVIKTVTAPGFAEHVLDTGAHFKAGLEALKSKYDCVRDVRGLGLMLGMELAAEVSGKQVVSALFERGFLCNCAGHNTLRFVPPLIIENSQVDALLDALDDVLAGC